MRKYLKALCSAALLLVLLAGATGCYLFPEEEAELAPPLVETQSVQYKTVDVEKASIVDKVTISATFMAYQQQSLFFEVDGRIGEVVAKIGDSVKKGDLLVKLDVDDVEKAVRDQKLEVEKQQLYYNQANAAYKEWYDTIGQYDQTAKYDGEVSLKAQKIDLENAKNHLSDYQEKLEGAYLYAPFDGMVSWVSDSLQVGDYISAYTDLMTISDPTQLMLRSTDTNAQRLVLGQSVTMTYNGQNYTSEVTSTPDNLPESMKQATNAVYFAVVEGLSYPGVSLGSTATINGIIDQRDDTIVIASANLKTYYGRTYVNVLNSEGLKEERNVQVGLQTSTQVEILDGLQVGDKIIVG